MGPDQPIELKIFHARVVNDHDALKKQKEIYESIPRVRNIDGKTIQSNYKTIKQDVKDIIELVMEEILNDPLRQHLLVKKGEKN